MKKFFSAIGAIIGFFIIAFIIDALFAWPIMILWNWIMVSIFSFKVITFWEAFGILLLSSILFKSYSSNTN